MKPQLQIDDDICLSASIINRVTYKIYYQKFHQSAFYLAFWTFTFTKGEGCQKCPKNCSRALQMSPYEASHEISVYQDSRGCDFNLDFLCNTLIRIIWLMGSPCIWHLYKKFFKADYWWKIDTSIFIRFLFTWLFEKIYINKNSALAKLTLKYLDRHVYFSIKNRP